MTRVKHSPDRIREDFWSNVKRNDPEHPGCWVYHPPKGKNEAKGGYAYIKNFERESQGAHIFVVELVTGKKVPKGFEVHHRTEGDLCTTKRCVRYESLPNGNPNPANHIEVVTETENARRATAKRVKELLKEDGIDPDTYAGRVLPPEMRPGSEDLPKTGLVGLSAPQLFEFYKGAALGRLLQRKASAVKAVLVQEARESEPLPQYFSRRAFVSVDRRQQILDDAFGVGRARWGKCHDCQWEVILYREPMMKGDDKPHFYTYEEGTGTIKPHLLVCHKSVAIYDERYFAGYTLWTQQTGKAKGETTRE